MGDRLAARPRRLAAVVAVWLITRGIALATITGTPWMLHDLDLYTTWVPTLSALEFPQADPTWQYPPGAALVFLAASWIPLPFNTAFIVMILAIDAALLAALVRAHDRREDASMRGVWLWALAGVIVGAIMLTRFDIVPTALAVAAILLVGRPVRSGIAAGLGFSVKLWPALMLLALPRKGLRSGVASFAVTVLVVLAFFLVAFDGSLSFLGNQRARGLQIESIGALPYEIHGLFGGTVAYGIEYGSMQVLMNGAEIVGTVVTLLGLAVIAVIVWWRIRGRLEDVPAGDVALTLVLVSVLGSRVYSPQFNVWIIGVCAAAILSTRTRMRHVSVILVVVAVLTQFVYPWFPWVLVEATPAGVAIQILRIAGLLAATTMAVWQISPYRDLRSDRTPSLVA